MNARNPKFRRSFTSLAVSFAIGGSILAIPINAQEQEEVSEDSSGIEVILVTSQKRSESLQEVGAAVSAIGGNDILAANFTDSSIQRLVETAQVLILTI